MNPRSEPEATLSPAEVARYEAAWGDYRVCEARYWVPFVSYIPGVALFGWLLSFVLSDTVAHGVVAFSWAVLWVVTGRRFCNFCCPRCGRRFFRNGGYHTLFSGRCLNCGLPKYAYDRTVVREEF